MKSEPLEELEVAISIGCASSDQVGIGNRRHVIQRSLTSKMSLRHGNVGRQLLSRRNGERLDHEVTARTKESVMTLIARFQVESAEPSSVVGADADWAHVFRFSKTFTSGIVGHATTLFMSAGSEGTRSYVATERISGSADDGREGELTVMHGGLESDPSTWFGHIVPGAGSGDFANWSGAARIEHDDEGAYFKIDLV